MSRRLIITIIVLLCLTLSPSVRAQQSERDMVQMSKYWLVHHHEIEDVINLAYYSWVNGDGDTYLSCFTPDMVWYWTYDRDPGMWGVGLAGRDKLKENVADKAEEAKENFTSRWLSVRHVHVAPEGLEGWASRGEAGNAHGIAVAGVSETSIDKESGVTTLHQYMDTYMMKRIGGKWMITGVIRKYMGIPWD